MPGFIIKQPNGLYCRYSTIIDDITHYNMTKEEYLDYVAETSRENAEYDWEHNYINHMTFDELKENLINFCPVTKEEWIKYNGGEYTEAEAERNRERRKEIFDVLEKMCSEPEPVKFEPKLGDYLYGIPSNEESAKYNPEDERVFIYNGHKSGDGWGKLIGFEDHRIVKSTEWNNFMWGGDVRLATETEVIQFMNRLMHQNNIFDR